MTDIDLKDRKILYYLDLNCRQSNTSIGKKVGLSRKVVEYRIKRMEDEGIIRGYWTNIDSYRFGYQVYGYYIVLQNATSKIRDEIIQKIVNYKNTWATGYTRGVYDIFTVIWVKSIPQFYQFWDNLNEMYGDYFAEKIFFMYLQTEVYPLSYLIEDENFKNDRKSPQYHGAQESIQISFSDYQLLESIVENPRVPTVTLAQQLGCSSQNASFRLKKLVSNGIIQGFHVGIDTSKLGYHQFKVDIWLKQLSKRRKIWNYIKQNPYVVFINTSAGYADLEIEFTIQDTDTLTDIIEDMSSQFPGAIRKYIFWNVKRWYKLRCLPKLTKKDFNKI